MTKRILTAKPDNQQLPLSHYLDQMPMTKWQGVQIIKLLRQLVDKKPRKPKVRR